MITAGGLGALGLTFADWLSVSDVMAAAASGETNLEPLNRFPRMTQEYFVQRVRRVEAAAEKVRSELKSKRDAQAYVKSVQKRIDESFGPWPKKTPLKPRIMGRSSGTPIALRTSFLKAGPDSWSREIFICPKAERGHCRA
jgi:hypothetical protein